MALGINMLPNPQLEAIIGEPVHVIERIASGFHGSRQVGVLVKTPQGENRAKYGVAYRSRLVSPQDMPIIVFSNLYADKVIDVHQRTEGGNHIVITTPNGCDGGGCYDTVYPSEVSNVEQMLKNNGF